MSLYRIRKWFERLPEPDRDLPILYYNGRYWTPREILEQIESSPNSPLSLRLQSMLEHARFSISALVQGSPSLEELAKKRLIEYLKRHPIVFETWMLGGPTVISAEDLIKDIEAGGTLSRPLIEAMKKDIINLLSMV